MKVITFLFKLLVISIFVSCSTLSIVTIQDYQDVRIKHKTLLIVLPDSSVYSIEPFSLFEENDFKSKFISEFPKTVELGFINASSFSKIYIAKLKGSIKLNEQQLNLPHGGTLKLLLPDSSEISKDENDQVPDFLLFISKVELSPAWHDDKFGPYEGYQQTITYVFWDNFKNKVVSYGKTKASEQFYVFQHLTYENTLVIVANSPFKK